MMLTSVKLRPVLETDLPVFYEQQLDTEATHMAGFPSRNYEGFMAHWKGNLKNDRNVNRTILFDGNVAGHIVCYEQLGNMEIGYWLGKEYWGKGIATRALQEFLKEIPTRPLYAHVARHNTGSRRVLEKCGFVITGEDRFFSAMFGKDIEELILTLDAKETP